jgi:hypothetical protein
LRRTQSRRARRGARLQRHRRGSRPRPFAVVNPQPPVNAFCLDEVGSIFARASTAGPEGGLLPPRLLTGASDRTDRAAAGRTLRVAVEVMCGAGLLAPCPKRAESPARGGPWARPSTTTNDRPKARPPVPPTVHKCRCDGRSTRRRSALRGEIARSARNFPLPIPIATPRGLLLNRGMRLCRNGKYGGSGPTSV